MATGGLFLGSAIHRLMDDKEDVNSSFAINDRKDTSRCRKERAYTDECGYEKGKYGSFD